MQLALRAGVRADLVLRSLHCWWVVSLVVVEVVDGAGGSPGRGRGGPRKTDHVGESEKRFGRLGGCDSARGLLRAVGNGVREKDVLGSRMARICVAIKLRW